MMRILIKFTCNCFAAFVFFILMSKNTSAQNNCIYKDTVFTMNFGSINKDGAPTMYNLMHYNKSNSTCPKDGYYTFASATTNCFDGRWHNLAQDHTAGDVNGKMMIVNAAEKPSDFFAVTITGLIPGAKYKVSAWFANICKYASDCIPTPPSIEITPYANDKLLGSLKTGPIHIAEAAVWQNYTGEFVMASGTDVISLQMHTLTTGGCGNDFALDDIAIIHCSKPVPQPEKIVTEPVVQSFATPVPSIMETRANPVVQQINTEEAELNIELYDNGEIDGDTVSIYHNNTLVVSHAGISTKPVSLKIKVDKANPHHELVMVADNLGRIPPNTSLMIITTPKKRYEVFISSSEQKNAKVVINLQ